MKKWLAFLLASMLCFGSASALEISDEDFDFWYDTMCWLVDEIGTRWVGSETEIAARDYLREQFLALGFSYEDGTLFESLSTVEGQEGENVSLIAVKRAKNPNPQIVTVCAHFDSVSPGARDNASGAAAMLVLCKAFTTHEAYDDTELRFIAFTAEESGHQGSLAYCAELSEDERARSLATFNIDILTLDIFEEDRAFSLDTMGMRTEDGYVNGSAEQPAHNRPALAMLNAMSELGVYPPDEEEVTWCGPRTLGMSDHESFHQYGIDSVNVCFRGTTASGGSWPFVMHMPSDLTDDLDITRSWDALNAVYTAVDGLASDHAYGT